LKYIRENLITVLGEFTKLTLKVRRSHAHGMKRCSLALDVALHTGKIIKNCLNVFERENLLHFVFGWMLSRSGRSPYRLDFNIMDIPICVFCFKIRSNPKGGRSTRMHCIYQNRDNIYWNKSKLRKRKTDFYENLRPL